MMMTYEKSWRYKLKLGFEKMRYKKMLRDVLKVTYGMTHGQAKEAIRKSTIRKVLDKYPQIQMHDSVEDAARIVYMQSFSEKEC